ncbi:MAG: DUF11 domain-containing protein [Chloroflexi bacterium]|nr:DUF11 domain-containing protein [Chloroflexota bacterium]
MVSFTLHISNTGATTATNVVVTDTLPAGLAVLTYTTDLVVTQTSTSPMVWEVADLAVGASGTITVVAMLADNDLPDGTVLTNNAEISADNDASAANNTASANVTVDNPVMITPRPRLALP